MTRYKLSFSETGGYDCMTGAWSIEDENREEVVLVDQRHFGQEHCDYKFKSPEAERVARVCLEALNKAPKDHMPCP